MASALEIEREARPAFVTFERVAVEDKAASLKAGHYVAKDVDYALITPSYSKDVMKHKVSTWFPQLEIDLKNGRIPESWVNTYKKQYEAFKNGQELPLEGTPIKGWGVISPAQQETLIKMRVLTVESLAEMNDEGVKRVGMGGLELKHKAKAWLSQLKDKGAATIEIADLKQKLSNADAVNKALVEKNEELSRRLKAYESSTDYQPQDIQSSTIAIDDVLEDDVPPKRGKSK